MVRGSLFGKNHEPLDDVINFERELKENFIRLIFKNNRPKISLFEF